MAFYNQFCEVKKELEALGHEVLFPEIEFTVDGDDTSVGAFFDRHGGIDAFPPEHEVWERKGDAIKRHFKKIDESDCVLITNYEKKGAANYIGGNTFLEIGYAFGNGKRVFILNSIPAESVYKEEILGMRPIVLEGDLGTLV